MYNDFVYLIPSAWIDPPKATHSGIIVTCFPYFDVPPLNPNSRHTKQMVTHLLFKESQVFISLVYCGNPKTMNTKNVLGMLLCFK